MKRIATVLSVSSVSSVASGARAAVAEALAEAAEAAEAAAEAEAAEAEAAWIAEKEAAVITRAAGLADSSAGWRYEHIPAWESWLAAANQLGLDPWSSWTLARGWSQAAAWAVHVENLFDMAWDSLGWDGLGWEDDPIDPLSLALWYEGMAAQIWADRLAEKVRDPFAFLIEEGWRAADQEKKDWRASGSFHYDAGIEEAWIQAGL